MTEVWFRNPLTYIRECAELLVPNIAWDRGMLLKRHVEPQKHLELHYPANAVEYRILLIGDQGTSEVRRGSSVMAPFAVYPTWEYGTNTMPELEEMLENPVGENHFACHDPNIGVDLRPVAGQEHRVVVTRWPDSGTFIGRAFLRELAELQEEYPEAIIHLHGTYSYRVAFGLGFRSADMDPRVDASKGGVTLGNGKRIAQEASVRFQQWVHLVGMSTTDLSVARNRCMFNMKSALWAGENFAGAVKFKTQGSGAVDPNAVRYQQPTSVKSYSGDVKAKDGDKIACDSCSLAAKCKYFRDGGVCAIPETDSAKLAAMFKTRDSDRIIEGLGGLIAAQVERAMRGIDGEQYDDKLDPETTKVIHFATLDGMKLAKLVNPALASAAAAKIGVFINNTTASEAPANGLVAGAVAALEAQGVARENITAGMVAEHIAKQAQPAIEASASG